jgi:tRNA nucleotidyltransferase (CCA-adding enzyme)
LAEQVKERGDPLSRGDLAITGLDLIEAGVPPGPALGRVLERLLALVVDDPSLNTRDALLARAKEPV